MGTPQLQKRFDHCAVSLDGSITIKDETEEMPLQSDSCRVKVVVTGFVGKEVMMTGLKLVVRHGQQAGGTMIV